VGVHLFQDKVRLHLLHGEDADYGGHRRSMLGSLSSWLAIINKPKQDSCHCPVLSSSCYLSLLPPFLSLRQTYH
jgi:hypothetical protein